MGRLAPDALLEEVEDQINLTGSQQFPGACGGAKINGLRP